jgi:hypothetical protein
MRMRHDPNPVKPKPLPKPGDPKPMPDTPPEGPGGRCLRQVMSMPKHGGGRLLPSGLLAAGDERPRDAGRELTGGSEVFTETRPRCRHRSHSTVRSERPAQRGR